MRSCFVVLALAACGFTPGNVPGATSDAGSGAGTDAMVQPDGAVAIDALLPAGPSVRRIDIADAQVSGGPHTSFPLLVSLSETWLRDVTSGGDVARADGLDIYFSSDVEGATRLAHQLDLYVPATGALLAWVKIPSLSATTELYLHYGDSAITTSQEDVAGVWTGGYEYVNHMDGAGDATGKNTNSVAQNVTVVDGRFGKASSLNGNDSSINAASASAVDNAFAGGGTAEGWFHATSYGEGGFARLFDKAAWSFLLYDSGGLQSLAFIYTSNQDYGQWAAPDDAFTLGAWHHAAVVYNSDSDLNDPQLFIDGASVSVTIQVVPVNAMDSDAPYNLHVGNRSTQDRTFDGMLDEMRLSSISRSAAWLTTQYRNQSSPSTFYTVSAPL